MMDGSGDTESSEAQPDKVREEASMWLARLDRGLRPEEATGLREWLKKADHRRCILDMARLWHGADIIAVLAELFPVGPEPEERGYTWRQFAGLLLRTVGVVGLIVLVVTGEQPWSHFRTSWARGPDTCDAPLKTRVGRGLYSTSVGEKRELALPDNTTVTLNTHTCMGVVYYPGIRQIYLPYGEATFHVAQDRQRPFFVRAGGRRFEALGTNFNVRVRSPDDVELTVTEGHVKVIYIPTSLPETPAEARLRDNMTFDDTTVSAYEMALVEPGMQFVRKIDMTDVDNLLAWQQGMISFKSEPLEAALAEIDRYTNTVFVLADNQLRGVRIDGRFHTGDVEGLLHTLRQKFLIDSHRDAQGRIVLTPLPHAHES
jgi:transmembrane sensor